MRVALCILKYENGLHLSLLALSLQVELVYVVHVFGACYTTQFSRNKGPLEIIFALVKKINLLRVEILNL